LELRLRRRHRFVADRFQSRASSDGRVNNPEAQEEYLKTLKSVRYQQEIDLRYFIFYPRFPFFQSEEQPLINSPRYWESLPKEAKRYFRDLYKSAEKTSAYNILYPPMCDKRVMYALNDDFAPDYEIPL